MADKKCEMFIYFKNGNVFTYEVANAEKAREHDEKIWTTGFRTEIDGRTEHFGPHYIDKIAWTNDNTYLAEKYKEGEGEDIR